MMILPTPRPIGARRVTAADLIVNCKGYWKCNEAAGATLVDSTGFNNHLSAANAPGSTTGIVGNARTFVVASSQYFILASNANLQSGTNSISLAFWVKFTDLTPASGAYVCVAKDNPASGREFYVGWFTSTQRIAFYTISSAVHTAASANSFAASFGNPALGTWYFVACGRNNATGQQFISVNDGPRDFSVVGSAPSATAGEFTIGARQGPGLLHNGQLDEIYWRQGSFLTEAETLFLYNGGAGRTHPFT